MSNKVPCCMGCTLYGHARGCTCPAPEDWPVTIRYSDAEHIADGTSRPTRYESGFGLPSPRVMHARFGVSE